MADASVAQQPWVDQDGRLAMDVPCSQCAYNLRTCLPDGVCPECGKPVVHSLRGDLLWFTDPAWLERLARGLTWALRAAVAVFVAVLAAEVAYQMAGRRTQSGITIGMALEWGRRGLGLVWFFGCWLVTSPEPTTGGWSQGMNARRVARAGILIAFLIPWLVMLYPTGQSPGAAWKLAQTLIWASQTAADVVMLVTMAALFIHLRRLALRMPALVLARHTRIVMWGSGLALALITVSVFLSWATLSAVRFLPPPWINRVPWSLINWPMGLAQAGLALVFGLWSLRLALTYQRRFRDIAAQVRQSRDL